MCVSRYNFTTAGDRDGHIITPPTSTLHTQARARAAQTHTRAETYSEFLLTHGSPLDAQSGCCQNELYLHYCCLLLTLSASGRVFNILFRIPVLYIPMATSDGIDGCLLQRGRSQSDPNILTESGIDLVHSTGKKHILLFGYYTALPFDYSFGGTVISQIHPSSFAQWDFSTPLNKKHIIVCFHLTTQIW